ncbi:hypothetical protein GCM10011344_42840 [Dokdonia pacifica]|uniref:Uncharacterized protein n=1 Tax=Dokdonia pacifica TaxID=1627892 RepID=A0A239AJC1_9FLAO|nr:hypothetical protein [Dokdonia pacifica]GGG37444.1 hypothetical protein GCM10011344_42840 [Dokdonia pacifica]SNR95023.1 hypothetical protein SAMN06265376_104440 [Dokdonia pacifica]
MKNILFTALALCVSLGYAQETTWEGLDLSNYPFIEGHISDAERYSYQKNKIAIYISGGQGIEGVPEQYTAREYAELLYSAFKDTEYTNYPTEIVVFYDEEGKDRVTKASVIICGDEYKTKSGNRNFTPTAIGNNIDIFTKCYLEAECLSSLKKTTGKGAGY